MLEIEYRGHTIRFNENSDEWSCHDVGYATGKLSSVKARIDKLYLDQRKAAAIDCYEISNWGDEGERTAAKVIEYVKKETSRNWQTHKFEISGHIVATVAKRKASEKPSRKECKLNELAPATPEFEAAWNQYSALKHAAHLADRAAAAAFKALPRLTLHDVTKLWELSADVNADPG